MNFEQWFAQEFWHQTAHEEAALMKESWDTCKSEILKTIKTYKKYDSEDLVKDIIEEIEKEI